jgi:ribosomal protein S18 acetylase RimI-like enzyme
MIKRDLPEILQIQQSTPDPLNEDCVRHLLGDRTCIGMVAEVGDVIAGHFIYQMHRIHLQLLTFAVHPDWQRRGVGRAMMDTLKKKLGQHRRGIAISIPEVPVSACLFLRNQGFRCTRLLRGAWGAGTDGLRFQWRIGT